MNRFLFACDFQGYTGYSLLFLKKEAKIAILWVDERGYAARMVRVGYWGIMGGGSE